jgi:hypothetical protein
MVDITESNERSGLLPVTAVTAEARRNFITNDVEASR